MSSVSSLRVLAVGSCVAASIASCTLFVDTSDLADGTLPLSPDAETPDAAPEADARLGANQP